MNMMSMMGAMQNPQMYFINELARQNPEAMKQCQSMFEGKSRKQQVSALRQLYKSKGMDLDAMAKQWGVQL